MDKTAKFYRYFINTLNFINTLRKFYETSYIKPRRLHRVGINRL